MFVYSGNCRLCETGIESNILDVNDIKLFTGDIVVIFTNDYLPDGLTVVVSDQFTTYINQEYVKHEKHTPYIMGLKDVDFSEGVWFIKKVKDHSDVISGEHWKDFGFSYKED